MDAHGQGSSSISLEGIIVSIQGNFLYTNKIPEGLDFTLSTAMSPASIETYLSFAGGIASKVELDLLLNAGNDYTFIFNVVSGTSSNVYLYIEYESV